MRSDPMILFSCDGADCGEELESGLTPLAGGGWDDRNVRSVLKQYRWMNAGDDRHYCERCAETRQKQ